MPDPTICNVCYLPITNPAEQVPRVYVFNRTGRRLPDQYKHDACDAAYAAQKTGLTKVP